MLFRPMKMDIFPLSGVKPSKIIFKKVFRKPRVISNKEKRAHVRFAHRATLICLALNTSAYYNTQKRNHSKGGLCFESEFEFQKGTIFNIRIKDNSTNDLCSECWEGFRTMSIGEVKWCRKIQNTKKNHFKVGVKYYDPAY